MNKKRLSKGLALLLALIMLASVFPGTAMAWNITYDRDVGSSYYNLISQREWDIAPGIVETEMVLNNDAGTRRQVVHTATIDVNRTCTPGSRKTSWSTGRTPKTASSSPRAPT